jgi:hypothetical protein
VNDGGNFARLGRPRRIWAVAASCGAIDRLDRIHGLIADRFRLSDRLVYLGNYLGGADSADAIDRILAFRTYLLASPGMIASDIVYLRGIQEEIWSKLLQIQFAPNPRDVLRWMLDRGAAETLQAYGGDAAAGVAAARDGAVAMTRWTNRLRAAMHQRGGHDKFMSVLARAAFTDPPQPDIPGGGGLLFVHAGLDPSRPLAAQRDSFWWESGGFARLTSQFETFGRIFRGADPTGQGLMCDGYAVTLDGGCGRGGVLIAAAIAPDGEILEILQA